MFWFAIKIWLYPLLVCLAMAIVIYVLFSIVIVVEGYVKIHKIKKEIKRRDNA